MIDLDIPQNRARLASSVSHWRKEHEKYRLARKELIMHYAGSPDYARMMGLNIPNKKEMMGNLLQVGGQAHALSLSFNVPQFKFTPGEPEALHVAPRLQAGVNRYVQLIGLGDKSRAFALDSYFGYAIACTMRGKLAPRAKHALGVETGVEVYRISQDNFIFDGNAQTLEEMQWLGHVFEFPLTEARSHPLFDPELRAKLQECGGTNDTQNYSYKKRSPQAMTRLVQLYFPDTNEIAIWSANNARDLSEIGSEPLYRGPYDGHYTGPYSVLAMLDIPDNLLPIAVSESVKRLHLLYNELSVITAKQAVSAKYNPVYEVGSQTDAEQLFDAEDRSLVGVTDINKLSEFAIPGPDQSQMGYMGAALQQFKEFSGNIDDILGTGVTAPTATQSQLIRQSVSARTADKRNRMNRFLVSIAQKIAHYFLVDPSLSIPARETIPGTPFTVDMSWQTPDLLPRSEFIDTYTIDITPYDHLYRDPAVRLQQFSGAMQRIFQAFQLQASGAPVDVSEYVAIEADLNDLPELKRVWSGLLPDFVNRSPQNRMAQKRENVGQYTRTNVNAGQGQPLADQLAGVGAQQSQGGQ